MGRAARIVSWGVAVVLAAGGAWWAGVAIYRHYVYGSVFTESHLDVRVPAGDRFSLAVPDRGASVGDAWRAQTGPGSVVSPDGRRTRPRSVLDHFGAPALGGGRGTTYFLYDANAPGTVRITLSNCFQGCDHPTNQALSRSVTWTVTVH